jgi:hypothetical protein
VGVIARAENIEIDFSSEGGGAAFPFTLLDNLVTDQIPTEAGTASTNGTLRFVQILPRRANRVLLQFGWVGICALHGRFQARGAVSFFQTSPFQ